MQGKKRESESLTIYHIGVHKCPLKPNINKYSHQVRDAVLRNSGLGTCSSQQAEVGQIAAVVTSRRHREDLCDFLH